MESSENMSILIIAEKPSAAQSMASALIKKPVKKDGFISGENMTITWAVGHLLSLAEPEQYDVRYKKWDLSLLPILPNHFRLIPNPKTKKQLNTIKELATKCSEVINACDSGREGELIFGYIMQYLRIHKPVRRLWTSSLTPDAIRDAFSNMKSGTEYRNLLNAAVARSESDWIIGINGTRAYTAKHKELLSVGRVQTPVLAMLAERQTEIENFKPEIYYEVKAQFEQNNINYSGIWQGKRISDKEYAEQLVKKVSRKTGSITSYDVKLKKEFPPKLYDLTLLQKEANSKFGFTAQKTLNLAQSLYEEHKAITYPRTNSNYIDESQISFMHKVFQIMSTSGFANLSIGGNKSYIHSKNKNICRPEKIEDHHAILPTERVPTSLSRDEEKLYHLIVKRFLCQFFPHAEHNLHTVITMIEEESFKSNIKEELQKGWKVVYATDEADKKTGENDEEIKSEFHLDTSLPVTCKNATNIQKETTPPKWYTEGTLVAAMQTAGKEIEDEELRDAMKDHGLGTPATRAGIIERLKKVGYMHATGKKLTVTPKGFALIEIVRSSGIGLLTSPEMTGQWEKRLNEITRGIATTEQFADQVKKLAYLIIDRVRQQEANTLMAKTNTKLEANSYIATCPVESCGGEIIEGRKGYGCSNWKSGCKFVIWKSQYGKKISIKNVNDLIKQGKTAYLKFKSKNKTNYEARFILTNRLTGETKLEFKNTNQLSPQEL